MSDRKAIRQAVILAAGQGLRLRIDEKDFLKPLYPLAGKPLILWVMSAMRQQGVDLFHIVVGFKKEELVPGIERLAPAGVKLNFIDNPRWQLQNGISLYCAAGSVKGRFFLSMSDHLFMPEMMERLRRQAADPACLYLAIDRKLETIFDMDDATKIVSRAGRIVDIGKQLANFDAVDTGLFICPPAIFQSLEEAARERGGDCSLSNGVKRLAEKGLARVADIGDAFWQDIDTPAMLAHAADWLARHYSG